MSYEDEKRTAAHGQQTASAIDSAALDTPGKHTLIAGLAAQMGGGELVQRKEAAASSESRPFLPGLTDGAATAMPLSATLSAAATHGVDAPVQRDAERSVAQDPSVVQQLAAEGIAGSGAPVPHADAIKQSFGAHAPLVDTVTAHVGGSATAATAGMGARAYATGDQVAFGSEPDLHTAAHEVAHVAQQRGGVQLKGGVGEVGDSYEQHANSVADRVVRGQSAEDLLGGAPIGSGAGSAGVQMKEADEPRTRQEGAPEDPQLQPQGPRDPNEAKKLTKYAGYTGSFEVAAARQGRAFFAPLSLAPALAEQFPNYQAFSEQYDLYRSPAEQTQRTLGRTIDLINAGAPRTPADIKPAVMAHFQKIDNVGPNRDEHIKSAAATQWLTQQDDLRTQFDGFMTAKQEMIEVKANLRATQEILARREMEAKKEKDEDELQKIEANAATLASIVDVSTEAFGYMTGAEEMMDVEETYTMTAEDGVQTAEVERKSKTEKLKEAAAAAGGALSLEGIFIALGGDQARYTKLKNDIDTLTTAIGKSKHTEDNEKIAAARDALSRVKLGIKGGQRAFSAKRAEARDAAQGFGAAMNGGDQSVMVTMIAEAYQELDLFGSRALQEAQKLHSLAIPAWNWLEDNSNREQWERQDMSVFAQAYPQVRAIVLDVGHGRDFLASEAPLWQQAAQVWRHFLSDVMGKSFSPGENDPGDPARASRKKVE